jgi:ADP-ribose pyrophosphatase YjhB (NUDIX family)
MTTILCYDGHGNEVTVSSDAVIFRPAAYGILIENEQVLLTSHRQTGLWHPPGSILETHETPTQSLKHHFRRVAGLAPLVGPLLFVEDQYRLDEQECAWQLSVLYYALDRPLYSTMSVSEMDLFEANWIPLAELRRSNVQFGYDAIQAGRLRLRL